jgi:uncharacterized membrane protein
VAAVLRFETEHGTEAERLRYFRRLDAEGVLRERYARGDVDETEFRQRLVFLRSPPSK